jgi:hypothetical protein
LYLKLPIRRGGSILDDRLIVPVFKDTSVRTLRRALFICFTKLNTVGVLFRIVCSCVLRLLVPGQLLERRGRSRFDRQTSRCARYEMHGPHAMVDQNRYSNKI